MARTSNRHRHAGSVVVLIATSSLFTAIPTFAQSPQRPRPPAISLEARAQERREGQVMPGDADPSAFLPPIGEASTTDAPSATTTDAASSTGAEPVTSQPAPQQPPAPAVPANAPVGRPVDVQVLAATGPVQIRHKRALGWTPWSRPTSGEARSGVLQLRTGLGAECVLRIEGTELRVGRLTRVILARDAGLIVAQVARGEVAVTASPALVDVRTPNARNRVGKGSRVSWDAFRGTTVSESMEGF